jgi:hypothetical protein
MEVPNMRSRTVIWVATAFQVATAFGQAQDHDRPTVVKVVNFKNQTRAIPTTTIMTAAKDGLYRVSIYMEQLTTNANNDFHGAATACPYLVHTDDSGVSSSPSDNAGVIGAGLGGCLPILPQLGFGSSVTYLFRAKANTPILLSTGLPTDPYPTQPWSYSVYVVVELITRR